MARRHPILYSASWRRRCERLLVCVAVLLPIPVFAASGLSLPLPGPVERLAASLVPFAEAAATGDGLLARAPGGSIVRLGAEDGENQSLALGDLAGDSDGTKPARGRRRDMPGRGSGARRESPNGGTDGRDPVLPGQNGPQQEPATQEPVKDNTPGGEPTRGQNPPPPPPPPQATPPPPPPATPPPPPPPPPPIVTDPGDTLDDVDDTVDDLEDAVDDVVPGLGK